MRSPFSTGGDRFRQSWRLTVVLAVLVLAVAGLPGVAGAGAPTSSTSLGADIFCESESGFLGINVFEEPGGEGPFLDVFFESFTEPFMAFGFTDDFEFDGLVLNADVEMFVQEFGDEGEGEPEPVPAGTAVIAAEWVATGEPEVFMDRFRDGNRWVEFRDTFVPAEASGSAVLDDVFDIVGD